MMRMVSDGETCDATLFPRRKVMRVGIQATLLGTIFGGSASWAVAAAPVEQNAGESEIFAFRSPDAAELVLALTMPEGRAAASGAETNLVRIHAGSQSWTVSDTGQLTTTTTGSRVFIGHTANLSSSGSVRYRVTVVSAPLSAFTSSKLSVWAEAFGRDGSRARVGSPVAARLLAQDAALSQAFNSVSPESDRAALAKSVARLISDLRAKAGFPHPGQYGEWLAEMLLPNVLKLDIGKPVGFTFAGQNGRHPSDQVADVVEAMLSGVVPHGAGTKVLFQATEAFPYFQSFQA